MNDLKIFSNEKFGTVRTVIKNNEPWFVAADVCKALEIDRTQSRRLDDDEKGVYLIQTPGGEQEVSVVNEPGLYSLVLGSRKPEAKEFKRWITHEVIPAIRKYGMYATEELLSDPDFAIKVFQQMKADREALKAEKEARKLAEAQNAIMAPKAEYFDELVDRKLLTNFRDTAKELGMPERKFTDLLIEKGYIYRDKHKRLKPIAKKNEGLFEIKDCYSEKSKWAGNQTMITPRGKVVFGMLVKKWKDE